MYFIESLRRFDALVWHPHQAGVIKTIHQLQNLHIVKKFKKKITIYN